MDWQTILNIVLGTAVPLAAWFFRQLWDAVQLLKRDLQRVEVDLPTNYVKKSDVDSNFDKIEAMLEKIFDKLDNKVDK